MRAITVLGFFLASVGFALSPLEQDNVFFDGEVSADNGRVVLSASVAPSRMPAGWYANVEGLDTLTVVLDGQPIATFGKDALPRSRIKGLDLSEYAGLLRPGNNQIELRTSPGRFWLRMWTSDNAWYPSNFHAHTTYSDGRYSVHDLLQLVLAEGARAYAITDHNTLAQCYDTAFHPVGDLNPIRGTEWTSPLGHANILGPEGATWFDSTMAVREMLDEASYRGGTVQINHPCDDELGFGWTRYPVLDSSVDCIEVFNNLTWFPGGPRTNDREALSWWHSLLVAGHTIAATGNSDYHGTIPGEGGPMESQTRVWAPSNHPDTILKYMKFGQGMVLDESDDGRVYIYADTNNNGSWDLVMGQHARVTSSRTIRFRAEVEDADWLDDFWVYNRYGTVHNHWFTNPLGPWDYAYEWTANYNAQSRDFVRAYLENAANDPELATNPHSPARPSSCANRAESHFRAASRSRVRAIGNSAAPCNSFAARV
ncbi:MAG: CehA/McbA family metallohydrolase, partial [candidate division WOR-3 bacterium]